MPVEPSSFNAPAVPKKMSEHLAQCRTCNLDSSMAASSVFHMKTLSALDIVRCPADPKMGTYS